MYEFPKYPDDLQKHTLNSAGEDYSEKTTQTLRKAGLLSYRVKRKMTQNYALISAKTNHKAKGSLGEDQDGNE